MKIESIEGAIFDLDGTLLDSMPVWDTLGEDYLRSIGKEPKADLKEKLSVMSLNQAAEYFISEYGVAGNPQEIMGKFNAMLSDFYFKRAFVKKGAKEFLELLKKKNIRMCIVTATDKVLAKKSLKNNQMLEYFEHIFTCNEMGVGKDSVEIFNEAVKSLGTDKEQTFIFEDALYAIKTAKGAGFPVVAVFDESAANDQEEIKNIADVYINSFLEMRYCID
nr:HAD family phosphatase [uncultured Aminipila sp.]